MFSTSGIARATARHPWLTIGAWVIILVLGAWQASFINDRTTSDFTMGGNPDSVAGIDLIEDRMGGEQALTETLVIFSDTLTVDDPAFEAVVRNATDAVRADAEFVNADATFNYFELRDNPDPADCRAGRRTGL